MQPNCVMSFRKRLKNRGYSDICIRKCPDGLFAISAVEPLAKVPVTAVYTLSEIMFLFR